jgi:cell division inhibitor SepF
MAGAMRRMGIYLGLVEDDDARGYARYDGAAGNHPEVADGSRYGRYASDGAHDERYDGQRYDGQGYDHAEPQRIEAGSGREAAPARDAEPVSARGVAGARPLGLAPTPAPSSTGMSSVRTSASSPMAGGMSAGRSGGGGSGPVGATAASLVVHEQAVPQPAPQPAPAIQPYRITTLHPRTYNEARIIGERFRDGMPVIMNLGEMDDSDAKRLVDFAAGLSFGLRGSIERVTAKVFLLSPRDVDVTAEDKARIREGGFFNQS